MQADIIKLNIFFACTPSSCYAPPAVYATDAMTDTDYVTPTMNEAKRDDEAKRHVNYNNNDNVPRDNLMHLIMLKAESAEYGAACLDGN
jgi:hypothetical protein